MDKVSVNKKEEKEEPQVLTYKSLFEIETRQWKSSNI